MLLLTFIFVFLLPSSTNADCEFPADLIGSWTSSYWTSLVFTNDTVGNIDIEGRDLKYTCYNASGTNYVIRSADFRMGSLFFNYYICLDIVQSNKDAFYHYIATAPNIDHNNVSVVTFSKSQPPGNIENVCNKNSQDQPGQYEILLRAGAEKTMPSGNCPQHLQGLFKGNFTDAISGQCPDGFTVDGCQDQSHILFNYTQCGANTTYAAPINYTCVIHLEHNKTTFATLFMKSETEPNPYSPFSCLEEKMVDGHLAVFHSAGSCRVSALNLEAKEYMILNQTETCLYTPTQAPSNSSQSGTNWTNATSVKPPGGQAHKPGGRGDGEVSYGNRVFANLLPVLMSFLCIIFLRLL